MGDDEIGVTARGGVKLRYWLVRSKKKGKTKVMGWSAFSLLFLMALPLKARRKTETSKQCITGR